MSKNKKIIIFAGPNGAGKTTFAQAFLPYEAQCPKFVNADLIAAGLSPFQPEAAAFQAGRLMLKQIHVYAKQGVNFAFETTLSGRGYARLIPQWQHQGYHISLYFLKLPNPEFAIRRVQHRVAEGGHYIPDEVVKRRFHAGLKNFYTRYQPIVDTWMLYDNANDFPLLIDKGRKS